MYIAALLKFNVLKRKNQALENALTEKQQENVAILLEHQNEKQQALQQRDTLNVIDAMSYQEWQYQTSRGISATLALGPGRALILADLPDSFMTIIILAGSTDGLTRDLLEELADSFDLSKLTPIVLPESLYIPSP